MATARVSKQFYRKPLPSSCIDFASAEGKVIFKEAMEDGTMECFFNLAAQFRTQDEPAYCGLSTLVMVLNALSVDPGRVWIGPWRWYHEKMLECCVPLEVVQSKGITLYHFSCLARCNSLDVDMVRALPTESVSQFRDIIKEVAQGDGRVLVSSYSRRVLGQAGDGHFSPIGGYHQGQDLVLIFDVARFKYPPHWVSVDLLWEAMEGLDKETGMPRGYLTLSRTLHTGNPTVLFMISDHFNLAGITGILECWNTWLTSPANDKLEKQEFLQILVSKFFTLWCLDNLPGLDKIFSIKIDIECCNDLSKLHKCAICDLLSSLEQQPLFQMINKSLNSGAYNVSKTLDGLVNLPILNTKLQCLAKDCSKSDTPKVTLSHFATIFLLAWPYTKSAHKKKRSYADFCVEYVKENMIGANEILENEVKLLKAQLSTILSYQKSMNSPGKVVMNTMKTDCCQGK